MVPLDLEREREREREQKELREKELSRRKGGGLSRIQQMPPPMYYIFYPFYILLPLLYILCFVVWIDLYECIINNDDCSFYGDCTNVVGSYQCTCRHGFTKDGKNCQGKPLHQ